MADTLRNGQTVTLGQVAAATGGDLTGEHSVSVTDVTHDSRKVHSGSLFVAVHGAATDGNRFVEQAIERGALGIISEQQRPAHLSCSWIKVSDARRALAIAAATAHRHPSDELRLIGITGTNGKTTTAYLIAAIAEAAGEPVAMIGTVECRIGDTRLRAAHTTPEASDTERLLRRAVAAGCRTAAMECSSHAIALHRCDALRYSVAVFTNLTQDHLDYHGTLEAYFAVKRRLFDGSTGHAPGVSVINVDDERGRELHQDLSNRGQRVLSYALDAKADVTARDIDVSLSGMRFQVHALDGVRQRIGTPLVGRPHVYNILAAIASGLALGYDLSGVITAAIAACTGAPGRFEPVAHNGDFAVIVDYAHTEDALINVLRTARDVARGGRVITVFGCGGDRDRAKRAPMGRAAASLSDAVIVTSDNPRTEDPEAIIADIEIGLRESDRPYRKITDRGVAIHEAIAEARAGDVVLIAGKGHEDYQIIGTETIHFDDREVAREALGKVKR